MKQSRQRSASVWLSIAALATCQAGRAAPSAAAQVIQPALGREVFSNSREPPFYRALDPATRARAMLGHAVFNTQFVRAGTRRAARIDGLGPLFNAASCDECHNEGADGHGPIRDGPAPQAMVVQLQTPGAPDEPITGDPRYGQVLNTAALDGLQPEARVTIHYRELTGHYPDGSVWHLRDPRYVLSGLRYGPLSPSTIVKPRLAPALFGDGLLDAVPEAVITREESPPVRSASAGIPAWQWVGGHRKLGRLGWQGASLSIRDQTGKAFAREMGLTNPVYRHDDCTAVETDCLAQRSGGNPEVSAQLFDAVVEFQRWLAVPAARVPMPPGGVAADTAAARALGRRLFAQIGCTDCHRPRLPVDLANSRGGVVRRTIAPYTDLRLHDLGPALADRDAAERIVPSRWRTAPLWGLGYRLSRERHPTFLHDGRARSVEEAILWHAGEGSFARSAFEHLTALQRQALLRWLATL